MAAAPSHPLAGAGLRIETAEEVAPVGAEWERLADAAGAGPFVRPGWFEAWLRAFRAGRDVAVVCARRGNRLAGVVPMLRRGQMLRSPTNWHTAGFGAVAEDEEVARALAAALVDMGSTILDVSFLDPAEGFAAQLEAAARDAGRGLISRPVLRSPYIDLHGDFEQFEGTLDSKFRRETRRRRRKLEEQGEVTLSFVDGRDGLDPLLDEGFAVEGSGWKDAGGTAIASNETTERFYRDVASWAAGRGWLQLGFLRLDGRAVAFSYCVVLAGTVNVVKVGFDPGLRAFAPGTLLTRETIARAFEQEMSCYDFLGAPDAYKLDWTSSVRERVRVQAFGRTPLGLLGHAAWRYGRPLAKRATQLVRR
ncbi:MAG: GNAT family N-acetyltransferase [Thermoleophilaceae bacterium]